MLLIDLTLIVFAIGAGYWAWRQETRNLYRRGDEVRPAGMGHREHERLVLRQRRRWRLIKSALYAVGGAVIGFGILMALALRR
jgi:hypothetical protein